MHNRRRHLIPATLALALTCAPSAFASSDKAWEELRAEVGAACLKAAEATIETPKVIVDPFGSDRFGLALVSGKAKGADANITHICVFDKQTKAVELGSELTDAALKPEE